MRTPVLDRRLTLEAAELLSDGLGGFVENWVSLGTLWARIAPRSGREIGVGGATLSQVPYRITVRAAPYGAASRPRPDQRFREGSRIFRIVSVADNVDNGRYLTCLVEEETLS